MTLLVTSVTCDTVTWMEIRSECSAVYRWIAMHRHRVFITAQYRVCGAGGGVVRMRGPRLWSPLAVVARAGAATSWDEDSGRAGPVITAPVHHSRENTW